MITEPYIFSFFFYLQFFFPDIYMASGLAKNFIQHQMQSRKFTNIDTKKRRYIQYSHTQNNKQYYSTIKIQLQKLNMF